METSKLRRFEITSYQNTLKWKRNKHMKTLAKTTPFWLMFSPHTAFHDLHLHRNLRSILIQNDVFLYVWSICVHVLIHFGNEFGASEPDFLKVETSKPRKVVGPVELPQQLVTFLHELAQLHGFIVCS
jgi:hypothetical protein